MSPQKGSDETEARPQGKAFPSGLQQFPSFNIQGSSKAVQDVDRYGVNTTLNGTNIRPIHISSVRQLFL